ncbi:MAG TPA: M23 family metallopeptidase [Chitinophagaceae bacterium]|nr:M23 family metallopeptidase [Chitinophagaceae bacterium]
MQRRLNVLAFIIFIPLFLPAQPASLPRHYFRHPLDIPMELAANFGELRPNHWHMGLDIRTNAKENYPVYAAAEGYIAHIGIRPQSFGRFIIINHPNGLSTLYAHLNDFYPALEEYVTAKQYQKQSWAIELDLSREQFAVTKGAFIAYSGNTGGSQGPHLHFEIFNTRTEKRLNPLLFDFPLEDDVPPNLVKLALYDRDRSIYDQTPQFFNLKNTDSGYIIPKIPLIKTGLKKVSFAIQAYDRLSGSNNPNGIYSASLYMDDEPQISFVIDSITYDETAYMNANIDYKLRFNGSAFIQQLSQLPGDHGPVYKKIKNDGVIEFEDTSIHAVRIDVKDPMGNTSHLNFFIQHDDSLTVNQSPNTNVLFAPNKADVLQKNGFELYLSERSLYDTASAIYFVTTSSSPYVFSDLYRVGDDAVPLHEDAVVRIKLKRPVPAEWQDKLLLQRTGRKGANLKKAVLEEQWLSAKFGDFGSFQIVADVSSPQINDPGGYRESMTDTVTISATRLIFTPTDNYGIKNFRAELDSQWIRFTNDKSRNWIYNFDERCPFGLHHLKVTVEDLTGNTTIKEWWFKRVPYKAPPPKKKSAKKGSGKKKTDTKKKSVKKKK